MQARGYLGGCLLDYVPRCTRSNPRIHFIPGDKPVSPQHRRWRHVVSQTHFSTLKAPGVGSRRRCRAYSVTNTTIYFDECWVWQKRLVHERFEWQRQEPQRVGHDVLLLVEHTSVYTLGRGSSLDNIKFPLSPFERVDELRRTERGGEVTWHGPGQVVVYPIMDLNYHKKDLHWYVRQLEEVVIQVLARHGLKGTREKEHTGVWVDGEKIAAIGIHASSWITSHGFSLNVNPDLRPFGDIIPCGIPGRSVTRLCDLLPPDMHFFDSGGLMQRIRADIMSVFGDVFKMDMVVKQIDDENRGELLDLKIFPTRRNEAMMARWQSQCDDQLVVPPQMPPPRKRHPRQVRLK